jgi:hypothetical protein
MKNALTDDAHGMRMRALIQWLQDENDIQDVIAYLITLQETEESPHEKSHSDLPYFARQRRRIS